MEGGALSGAVVRPQSADRPPRSSSLGRLAVLSAHLCPSEPTSSSHCYAAAGCSRSQTSAAAGGAGASFTWLPDIANVMLGSKVIYATDEWFAVADNLLPDEEPEFIAGKFTVQGKVRACNALRTEIARLVCVCVCVCVYVVVVMAAWRVRRTGGARRGWRHGNDRGRVVGKG